MGRLAQLVTLTADPGGRKFDPDPVPYFLQPFTSLSSRRVVVSYERKYVHKVLINRLVKLAQD